MQRNDLLIGLIEQAASAIIMISPDDLSEVDSLQKIFDQIKTILDETKNAPAEILEQAKNSTTDSLDLIEKILNKQTEDYAEALKKMSDDIAKLQSVSEQLQIPEEDEEEKPEKTDGENTETKNEQTVIPEDDVPLVLDFIAESTEHIETAETGLLDLEKDPEDKEAINLIFRAFHTIKGMAGFLNLTSVSSLAHFAENLLDLARKDELTLAGNNTDVTFESLDALKKMIAELKDSIESEKPVPAHDGLEQLMERLQAALTGEKLPDTKQQQPEQIQQTEQVEQPQQDEQIEPQQKQESQQQSTETWDGRDRR